MTIATWNLERTQKTSKRLPAIIDCIKKINPDILVLTIHNLATNTHN